MPENGILVSNSARRACNRGAYSSPYSGVGEEFLPLGVMPGDAGFTLHETGYDPENCDWNFPRVLSPFWRLYYNARDGQRVLFEHRSVELTPEHLVLIPDRQLFHCQSDRPAPHLWLAFSVLQRPAATQSVPLLLPPTATEQALLRDLTCACAAGAAEERRRRIFHGSMALLHVVLSRPELRWQASAPQCVLETVRHIEQHYAEPLYIPALAARVALSTEALARWFKRAQGETIGQFIVKVRVRRAADLLAHTALSLEEVAERSGFPNRFYLSRVFKKITGAAPAEFRQRHAVRRP